MRGIRGKQSQIVAKDTARLLFLFAILALIPLLFYILHNVENKEVVFISLLLLFVMFSPFYLFNILKNGINFGKIIGGLLLLNALLALCGGGLRLFMSNFYNAGLLVIATGLMNAILLCILMTLYIYEAYMFFKVGGVNQNAMDTIRSVIFYIPMSLFPFLINSII